MPPNSSTTTHSNNGTHPTPEQQMANIPVLPSSMFNTNAQSTDLAGPAQNIEESENGSSRETTMLSTST